MRKITRRKTSNSINWQAFKNAQERMKTLKVSEDSVPFIRRLRGHDD